MQSQLKFIHTQTDWPLDKIQKGGRHPHLARCLQDIFYLFQPR